MNAQEKNQLETILKRLDRFELHLTALTQLLRLNQQFLEDKEKEIKTLQYLRGVSLN